MARPLTATIDLNAILHNYRYAKKLQPTCKAFAVVKSNAYGHGAVKVAQHLDQDVDAFAVATIEEALALREADITSPVLLLEGVFEAEEWLLCEQYGFWSAIENSVQLNWLLESKAKIEKIFVKMDTGMHRLGMNQDEVIDFVGILRSNTQVDDVVLMTHFACADDLSDITTMEQLTRFEKTRQMIGQMDAGPIQASVANSAAIMKWSVPEGGWIRPGLMMYGISPFAGVTGQQLGLAPAMTLSSKVISVRALKKGDKVGYGLSYEAKEDHQLATIAAGYGDGYPRTTSYGAPMNINSLPGMLAGRVSMDMITAKLTNAESDLEIGQDVILWGVDVPVEEVADYADTIAYELVTRMTSRPHYKYETKFELK